MLFAGCVVHCTCAKPKALTKRKIDNSNFVFMIYLFKIFDKSNMSFKQKTESVYQTQL
jgi:hypothetical protein